MRVGMSSLLVVSMLGLGLLGSARAARADGMAAASRAADQQFVQKAYGINQAEITLGQMAERKGASEEVRAYGARMVADHTKGLTELKAAAAKDKVPVPSTLTPEQQKLEDELSGLSGGQFDDVYMKHMVAGHGAAIDVFAQEIALGTSPALRKYAEEMLPTLESHESAADQGEDQLRGSSPAR